MYFRIRRGFCFWALVWEHIGNLMISQAMIDEVTKRLVAVYNPVEIYLFGSYAWGTPSEQSDLDLMVVVESSHIAWYKRSAQASEALWDLRLPKDLIVYTKTELQEDEKKQHLFAIK